MKNKLKQKLIASVLAMAMLASTVLPAGAADQPAGADFALTGLTTEYREAPIGIDTQAPRFSWKMTSPLIGQMQSAYEVKLYEGSAEGDPVWTTGRVEDSSSVAIRYDGEPLKAKTEYSWTVTVWDEHGCAETSDPATFETALGEDEAWQNAAFLQLEKSGIAPIFRTEQPLAGEIFSARLYITALGVYQAYLNGEQVGVVQQDGSVVTNHMNPGYGNTDVELTYQTYDVTSYLKGDSAVALSILAGTGWYNGMGSSESAPAVKAMLELRYADGSTGVIATNTQDWKGTLDGPITFNSIWDGETYDATKAAALGDYTQVGYDDSDWTSCQAASFDKPIVASEGEDGVILDQYEQHPVSATVYEGVKEESTYPGGEINVKQYVAYERSEDPLYNDGADVVLVSPDKEIFDGGISLKAGQTMVIDIGQNMAGIPNLTLSGAEGTTVTMRFAEMLNDGGEVFTGDYNEDLELGGDALYSCDGPKGSVYLKSLRTAKATATYTCAGEESETYQPALTFFGYRYISVTATDDITITGLRSRVTSSVSKQTGFIETNNADLNRFFLNTIWGQLSNYFTIPTDCPQRNEREAWTGDGQVFCQTGLYNFDSASFLSNFQGMIADNTLKNGFPGAVTSQSFFSYLWACGWSDIAVILPYTLYLQTGDTAMLTDNWDAMVTYMNTLIKQEREPYASSGGSFIAFGDWLAFQGTGVEMMADLYYGYVTQLMAQAAETVGDAALAAEYCDRFEKIKETFLKNHVTFDESGVPTVHSELGSPSFSGKGGVMEKNSQTSLLWMLKLGIYTDEEMHQQLLDLLETNIRNENPDPDSVRAQYGENTLAVGFLGSNVIAPVLTNEGSTELSYDLLLQDTMPSWLFPVKQGATTVWERWNSYSKEDGFGHQEMNSFNHYSYGSVVEWMYKYMVGIASDPEMPGFQNTILQPTLDTGDQYNSEERINRVNGSYDSYYGVIESNWTSDEGELSSYEAVVPANTTATLYLPVSEEVAMSFKNIDGVTFAGMEEHNGQMTAKLLVQAGGYTFTVENGTLTATVNEGYVSESTADKGILRSVLAYAEAQYASDEFDKVIASVQESFTAALENARAVDADLNAEQAAVDSAWQSLMTEIHKLGFIRGDKTSLGKLIEVANGYAENIERYTEATAAVFTPALEAAKTVYSDGDAMQGEVSEAENALLEAMEQLRYKADKSILEAMLAEANKVDTDNYTAESVAAFNAAKEAADAVYGNDNATQQETDAAAAALREAMSGLQAADTQSTVTPEVEGDKTLTTAGGNAKTGETAPIAAAAMLAIVACAGFAGSRKRK